MSHAKMVASPFEFSPLNELYRGKLVLSITYTLRDMLMIFGKRIYQVKMMSHM